jgi:hypothetical protein
MSETPKESAKCKWCGAKATVLHRNIYSHCGTWISTSNHAVSRSARCERDELRRRVNAAVNVLERAIQLCFTLGTDCLQESDLDGVIEILRGNTPTNLEGSE